MLTKKSILLSLVAITFLLVANSCKKCTVADNNEVTGIIVKDAIIYPKVGYISTDTGIKHFTGVGIHANSFEVSFDGGHTRVPVNWGAYDILANPMTIKCKASILNDVKVDAINSIVTYTSTATTCKSCEQDRRIENFVLVPTISSGSTVWFDPIITEN
ncbi:MAG TPA: hypothetical protein EYG86_06695 [Crocinitomicaceae bacterium]|nr:hypothetical protein [Crocinitomicaceae bacterium]